MTRLLLAAWLGAMVLGLGGCAVYTPDGGAVIVDPGRAAPQSERGGGFCPPGQAKKGRC